MSIKNTGAFGQFPRLNSIQLSTANTNYTNPTTPGLLWVAGPDGSEIHELAIAPTATVTTANQMQFFTSPDGGTTFNLLPMSAVMAVYAMAQTTAIPVTVPVMPNGVPMGPTNPLMLPGIFDDITHSYAQSTLSELTNYFHGGVSQGTVNAQTLPNCVNGAGTALGAAPATGTIVDFTAGAALTNNAGMTIAPGAQVATAIKRTAATALSAGDVTAGFRYRMVFDGTQWILRMTTRLYFAMGQAQAVVATAWGVDR